METKVLDRSVKLCRVEGSNLDPKKHWYVLTVSLCGLRPNAFAKSEIFRRFPDELRSVPPAGLKPAKNGCSFNTRQPGNSYVVSSFGLCARDLQYVVQNGTLLRIKTLTLLKGGGC